MMVNINPHLIISLLSTIPVEATKAIRPEADGKEYPKVVASATGSTSSTALNDGLFCAMLMSMGTKTAATVALFRTFVSIADKKTRSNITNNCEEPVITG